MKLISFSKSLADISTAVLPAIINDATSIQTASCMDVTYEIANDGTGKITANILLQNDQVAPRKYYWFIPLVQRYGYKKVNQELESCIIYIDDHLCDYEPIVKDNLRQDKLLYCVRIAAITLQQGSHHMRLECFIKNFAFHRSISFIRVSNRLHLPWFFVMKSSISNIRLTLKFQKDAIIKPMKSKNYFARGVQLDGPIRFGNSIVFMASDIHEGEIYGYSTFIPFSRLAFSVLIVIFAVAANIAANSVPTPSEGILGWLIFSILLILMLFLGFCFCRYYR
jgi:hypothetical protein